MRSREAYDELLRQARADALLATTAGLLAWDEETYLPPRGAAHRGEQLALLAGMQHAHATDPRVGELLAAVEGSDLTANPLTPEAVNVREWRRAYNRQTKLPRRLVEELARVTSLAQPAWAEALRKADFLIFRPWLAKVIALKSREAACLGYADEPYDALLEEHEPGATTRGLARLFDALRRELVPLVEAIATAPRRTDPAFLCGDFPVDRQHAFALRVAEAVGFDFRRGRLDTTTHPFFSTVGPDDCRLATRYDPGHVGAGLFALLHEVGHGLYEQGFDRDHYGTPMADAPSVGMHESQARLWENFVGRSRPFWEHFLPLAREQFPGPLRDARLDHFHRAVNHVEPSLNRVRADEVTYNLHVLARFELEQALVGGDLQVADLPTAWADAYRRYLGVVPTNDAEGCLQDGHWSAGLLGYFPTYTLGNLFAAQFFAKAEADLPGLDGQMARGDFGGLLNWLRAKVYRHGSRFPSARLVEVAAGAPPDHRPLVAALRRRYGELLGC